MVKEPGKSLSLTQVIVASLGTWVSRPAPENLQQWQEKLKYTVNSGVVIRYLDPTMRSYSIGFVEERSKTSWEWKPATPSDLINKGILPEKLLPISRIL